MVLDQASKIGDSMAYNEEIRAIDCIVDENTTAHRYRYKDNAAIATYNDNTGTHTWDNLSASTALVDWTSLDTVEQLANAITDPLNGRPVNVALTDLIVTKQLENKANYIINSMELHVAPGGYATSGLTNLNILGNPYRGRYTIRTSKLLAARMATDTSWFLLNIAKAFARMEVVPMQVFQAAPNNHREFNNDIIAQYKVRGFDAYATTEPRYALKATA
jgi:hypothetical protein